MLLVGCGPLAKSARNLPEVILEGAVKHDRIPEYMNAADVVYSGLGGIATLEALPARVRQSHLNTRILKHVLCNEETCILVRVGDVDGLVDALERLHADRDLRKRLGDRA